MNENAGQETVFAFLADPRNHGGAPVRRIDTHAASVFLAGERAYKVKRAVKLPYLDYSTLEKRREACLAELRVNKAFAPDLYLGMQGITLEAGGKLQLDGAGTPVEWAVVMRRFDEERTLDLVAEQEPVADALADELAREVAQGHARAPAADARAWLRALPRYVEQNCDAFRRHPDLFGAAGIERLEQESRDCLRRIELLILARAARGLVRRGHGDLHLGNIALIDGGPVIFDALEFDEVVASGDVLYDLGFLLMDLIERRQERAANIVLNRYLQHSLPASNIDGLGALPLYLSLRASIRAVVTVAKLERGKAANEALEKAARNYFRHALEFLSPPRPRLVAVGGLSGTGKSVLAADIAAAILPHPGAVVLRSDVARKNMLGVGELDRLADEYYVPEWNEKVYAFMMQEAAAILAAGHSAILDAVFTKEPERRAAEDVARRAGAEFLGVFLVADLATRLARIEKRRGDASDATMEVALRQEQFEIGEIGWTSLDAGGDREATKERFLDLLRQRGVT